MIKARTIEQTGRFAFLGLVSILIVLPVYWMINTSFKAPKEVFQRSPTFYPHDPTLMAYEALTMPRGTRVPFVEAMVNSLIAAVGATIVSVVIGICAAYALTRLRFPGRDTFSGLVFGCYVFPGILLFIPIYIQFQQLGLLDTFTGLIIAYQIFGIPFATWMLRSYFVTIPLALEEAARIDGCSRLQSIFYIVIPLAAPGIAASTIFTFTTSWNEFLFAQVIMQRPENQTAQVALYSLMNGDTMPWNQLMAASVLVGIPVLLLYFGAQRFVGGGLTAGAVK